MVSFELSSDTTLTEIRVINLSELGHDPFTVQVILRDSDDTVL